MAPHYLLVVPAGEERVLRCRLMAEEETVKEPFAERNFGAIFEKRIKEANEFYHVAIPCKSFNFVIIVNALKCYCDQKALLGFLRISKLCLQNNPHAKF